MECCLFGDISKIHYYEATERCHTDGGDDGARFVRSVFVPTIKKYSCVRLNGCPLASPKKLLTNGFR
jgi:hypothetical protein